MYFNRELVLEMFASSVQSISRRECRKGDSFITALSSWQQFFDRAIIVPVAGDRDNPSDSGFSFARIARQHLGFDEMQILSPGDALLEIGKGPRPIIFVDDFVGTGSQFTGTWFFTSKQRQAQPLVSARSRVLEARAFITAPYCALRMD